MSKPSNSRKIIEQIVDESGDEGVSIKECAARAGYSYIWTFKCLEALRNDRRIKKIVFSHPYQTRFYAYTSNVEAPNYALKTKTALFKFGADGANAPTIAKRTGIPYQKAYELLKDLEIKGEAVVIGKNKGAKFILKKFIQ